MRQLMSTLRLKSRGAYVTLGVMFNVSMLNVRRKLRSTLEFSNSWV